MINPRLKSLMEAISMEDVVIPQTKSPDRIIHGNPTIKNLKDPENWIFLEARTHGSHKFPDLYVCLNRLAYGPEVETIKESLDFDVQNTAQLDGIPYIGNINHGQAMRLVKALGYSPLSLRLGVDFLKELRDGARGAKDVYDGNRNKVDNRRLENYFKEITEVRDPYRAEWYSDRFGENTIIYTLINPDGTSQEITEPINGLMEDRKPGINLDYWLDNATPQGLPPLNISQGDLWYWHPVKDRVAGFDADSVRVFLFCDGDPGYSFSALGVRVARRAAQN